MNGELTRLQELLRARQLEALARREALVRRCWYCGSWAYDTDDCTACAAPATKAALLAEETA